MPFSKNDIICDYHGTVISKREGEEKMAGLSLGEHSYIRFLGERVGSPCALMHNSSLVAATRTKSASEEE